MPRQQQHSWRPVEFSLRRKPRRANRCYIVDGRASSLWLEMYDLAGENELDLEALRARLRRMNDKELLRFVKFARYMCSPEANPGKEPRHAFVIQLREAVEEWRRRRPTGSR